jgi:2-polyprenyl-6-hydroxyphenyl methylase/3-demethylubiquinone-9 3-methyltransferase
VTDPSTTAGWPATFGNIVLLDVLYLLPWEAQERLLDWALSRLAPGTGSALVIKSMEEARGLSGFRALAEEWVMVHLLRRTRHSGTITGARPALAYAEFADSRGFRSEVEDLGTFNPSYFIRIRR